MARSFGVPPAKPMWMLKSLFAPACVFVGAAVRPDRVMACADAGIATSIAAAAISTPNRLLGLRLMHCLPSESPVSLMP
jgi:hypothetical protein